MMSSVVDILDKIDLGKILLDLQLNASKNGYFPSSSTYPQPFLANTSIEESYIQNETSEPTEQAKKKKKRIRSKKKTKNKAAKDKTVQQDESRPGTSPGNTPQLVEIKYNFAIKAVRSHNYGIVFRKRSTKCQFINFEYVTKFNEPYIFDSREFVKLEVINESPIVETNDKTVFRNGTTDKTNENLTNYDKILQSSTSQARVKKRKQKRIEAKVSKKVEPFSEYYNLQDITEKLRLGELVKGTIRINPKSHKVAYVNNEDRQSQDYIVTSVIDRNRALEGDVVALELKPESEWVDNQKSASVVYIFEKVHPRTAIGSLSVFYDRGRKLAALQPRDKRIPRIVIHQTSLPPMYFKNPEEHEDVLFMAKITEWKHAKYAEGIITERVGVKDDLQSETTAILMENQLDVTPFPPSIDKYLPRSSAIPKKEFMYREDLRDECIFTIDPLTARDLDDAVSCKTLPNGNLEVGVHIADVSFYLEEDTELDEIVSKKGTTIYLVDNVYHMLPVELCMHCSLLPGKDCLAFSVFLETTEDGEILNHRFARTIINSCCQLAYEHAQEMIDHTDSIKNANLPDIYNGYTATDLCDIVNNLRRISSNLRKKRFDSGALRIDQTKILFRLDATGQPMEFFEYENIEAHRLIEELMLLANITVARKILNDFPKIAFLRLHEPPNPRLMKETQEVLENIGVHIDVSSSGAVNTSLQNYFTSDTFGLARNSVLNHLFAKPMTRARYICAGLEDSFEHYALSVDTYTHFTSPIRRYADIMVHRLLAASLRYSSRPNWDVDFVQGIAANCNKKKYNAKKAGEASSDLFLAYYVDQNQPFVQDAVVIDVREQSFLVMVLNTGSVVRMYANNLGEDVKHELEKVGASEKKMWRMHIEFANGKKQIIEIFQIVKVQLKRKGSTFNLEAQLIQPELVSAT